MIYLDNNSTTRVDPRVVDAMLPFFSETYGNAASSTHELGRCAKQAVDDARSVIANSIGAQPDEIVFTSGATESNNLAIRGVCTHRSNRSNRVATLATEHRAVLDPVNRLANEGFETIILSDTTPDGLLESLSSMADNPPALVSIMAANNEIGTLNDVHRLSGILSNSTIFHTDAAQALGKMDFNVHQSGIHLLSLSAHKIYGPKGIGALFVRRGTRLKPLWDGGGHERGKRSGTLNVSGIVGFAKAIQLLMDSREEEETRIRQLMGYCLNRMAQTIDHVKLNGPAIPQRLLGNLNFQIDGIDAETLALKIPDLCISTGSACTSADPEPSHVLQAIGLNEMQARSSIRIGIGRFNTEEDVECAVLKIAQVVRTLRP